MLPAKHPSALERVTANGALARTALRAVGGALGPPGPVTVWTGWGRGWVARRRWPPGDPGQSIEAFGYTRRATVRWATKVAVSRGQPSDSSRCPTRARNSARRALPRPWVPDCVARMAR